MRSGRGRAACFLAVSLVVVARAVTWAADEKETTAQVKQVALFKNGIGYFLRAGQWGEEGGAFVIRPLPASSHGSFWLAYDAEVKVRDLRAREAVGAEPTEAASVADLLRANPGEKVRLYLRGTGTGAEMRTVEGVILPFPEVKKAPGPDPYASGRGAVSSERYMPPALQPELLLLQTDTGTVGVNVSLVQEADFLGGKVSRSLSRKVDTVELAGTVEGPARKRNFTLTYLAKGIAWAPSYQIDISQADSAVISAKAEVVNEVEDLKGVTLQLVTGFPNLQFADVPSPLSLKLSLAEFFQYLLRPPEQRPDVVQQREAILSNAPYYFLESATSPSGGEGRMSLLPQLAAAGEGGAAEDLFLYPIKEVTLAKGEVGYYPLFSASVPYQHIYQWSIPDYVGSSENPRRPGEAESREVVWHSLRLQNTSGLPWTTAPAMTVAQGQVLGQDTLTYTPVGGSVTVKVTQAVGVGARQQENEVERERQAVSLYGRAYDRVTIEGRLQVHNYKKEPITLEVTKTFSGELKASTPEAQARQLAQGLKELNPTNTLTWQLTVKPDEAKELTYTYSVLVGR